MKRHRRAKARVAVGLSGGVDSSVALALLKDEGYDCVGLTFRMWPKEECGHSIGRACCNLEAITRARAVAESLKVPYYVIDLHKEFRAHVIDYFCREYLEGRTPNPCIVCNEKIKFGLLLDKARSFGARSVATGHYAKVSFDKRRGRYLLRDGKDTTKSQSYFLFSLSQTQLAHALFPLGALTKEEVRAIAKKYRLKTFDAASSQDVCFIRDADYAVYIKEKTGVRQSGGAIVDASGKVLGRHRGIASYTIGQRRGLGIAAKTPLYVTGIDIGKNRVVVGEKKEVLKDSLVAHRLNWIAIDPPKGPLDVTAMIRYNHPKVKARITRLDADSVRVDFAKPQEAPTPGQAVVFYDRDVVIGGGWIKQAY